VDGTRLGKKLPLGDSLGKALGASLGKAEGASLGEADGDSEGDTLGGPLGGPLGALDGDTLAAVGTAVGAAAGVKDGVEVGAALGALVSSWHSNLSPGTSTIVQASLMRHLKGDRLLHSLGSCGPSTQTENLCFFFPFGSNKTLHSVNRLHLPLLFTTEHWNSQSPFEFVKQPFLGLFLSHLPLLPFLAQISARVTIACIKLLSSGLRFLMGVLADSIAASTSFPGAPEAIANKLVTFFALKLLNTCGEMSSFSARS